MPEWPEMETYRKMLTGTVAGQTIQAVEVAREKTVNIPAEQFKQELAGRTIWFVERRGKYILFHLDNGKRLLLHLMLGGLMYYGTEDDKPDRTTQVTFQFDKGHLYFIGLRLGFLHYLSVKEVEERIGDLGLDPFDKRLTLEHSRPNSRANAARSSQRLWISSLFPASATAMRMRLLLLRVSGRVPRSLHSVKRILSGFIQLCTRCFRMLRPRAVISKCHLLRMIS